MSKPVYPYIPNSVPEEKTKLLKEIGIDSVEEIFKEIPDHLRFKGKMNIPEPFLSEYELRRHVEGLLAKNKSCKEYTNFLGAGTWQHYVPSVVDEIITRDEFLTAYVVGDAQGDHGKWQALFESASMIGEMTGFEAVNKPTYDWANAIAIACRMAARMTGRREILVAGNMSPGRLSVVKNYCKPEIKVEKIKYDKDTGLLDLTDLKAKISSNTAAVYFENPSYLGFIETQGEEIAKIAHDNDAEVIAGVDPSSLGVLAAPADYGADFAVGDYQPLGLHMQWGGGLAGFICTRDDKRYVAEYPGLLYGITTSVQEGEYSFGEVFYERTSYASREKGKDFIGTTTALWGIAAGVYMALMGPQGFRDLGEGIMQRVKYAQGLLSNIKGIKVPVLKSPSFKEFVVNFDGIGKTVAEINKALLEHKIFGGKDLSQEFPEYGQSALYCITEIHTKEDIKKLALALEQVIQGL
ncbi:aminomethyl-transferring glycine dehydrogenase subunit GcvPA [Phosphitispora fastidiosa]|uniref:aminomethyl-transferring glycine dehydrogenase subunit GcvPA n=1 Tax=Phosphitispora fastidiosa TaxID=2837202 RepID=UPI001E60E160|nr:aminomethyl-transferring glycine dehydrogenase subunit GcvPA [Phosphitispora fastidiosa]MBU7005752.1 glycine dehydrogenase subunit 1 [Phosphitispora fastidiosa]